MAKYGALDILTPLAVVLTVAFFCIGGRDIGTIAKEHITPIEPATWTFAIWGLIWLIQIVALVWLLIRKDDEAVEAKQAITGKVGPWWIGGSISEIIWYLFYRQNTDAFIAAAALALCTAAFCFIRATFLLNDPPATGSLTVNLRAVVSVGIAMNAAWATAATLISVIVTAPDEGNALALAVVLTLGAGDLVLWIIWKTWSITFALTWVWAFVGIFVGNPDSLIVRIVAGLYIVMYTVAAVVAGVWRVKGGPGDSTEAAGEALLEP